MHGQHTPPVAARATTTSPSAAAPVQKKSKPALQGLGFSEQEALLTPPPEGGGVDAVQLKEEAGATPAADAQTTTDTREELKSLDDAAFQKVSDALSGSAAWKDAIDTYAKDTFWGYVPATPELRTKVQAALRPEVDKGFRFTAPASIELFFQTFGTRLVEEIKLRVLKRAPTDVWGRTLREIKLKDGKGKEVAIPTGRVVRMTGGENGKLKVEGMMGGEKTTGEMALGDFQREPGLTTYDHDQLNSTPEVRREYGYKDMAPSAGKEMSPDSADPKTADVSQGGIGDCYLMAGMGAVAAGRADLIKQMIKYDKATLTYTVTFKEKQGDGSFKDVPVKVTAFLPTASGASPVYAQDEAKAGGDNQALWPAIVEKAYAAWKGDYQTIVGGSPGKAMEAITGAGSTYPSIPAVDQVISLFKQYAADKKAVCCGTVDDIAASSVGEFSGTGVGPYSVTLKGSGTKPATILAKSVNVQDAGGKVKNATDDGDGKMKGADVKEGTITYKGGGLSLTYNTGKSPTAAKDLKVSYRYKRLISEALNLYGDHAYMFVKVDGDKLVFQNPWGPSADYQPKPIPAADFVKLFESISVNAPPKLKQPGPGGGG